MTWDFQQCGMCDHQRLRPACAYAQSGQSLCWSLECSMIVKLLTEHHLEFLSLKGGCRDSSESTLVKMSNWWKSHVTAHLWLRRIHFVLSWVECEKSFITSGTLNWIHFYIGYAQIHLNCYVLHVRTFTQHLDQIIFSGTKANTSDNIYSL